MKLYTRFGDQGQTALFDGTSVHKHDPRVRAYGEIDELNAHLGLTLTLLASPNSIPPVLSTLEPRLTQIQNDLFTLGAELATPQGANHRDKIPLTRPEDFARLETWIDEASAAVPPLRTFILPGGHPLAAHLQVARTVCRRAERDVCALAAQIPLNPNILIYLNRLSDLLFAWARLVNHAHGIPDGPWVKRASAPEEG